MVDGPGAGHTSPARRSAGDRAALRQQGGRIEEGAQQMLLENKKLLITGVLTRQSIAFSAAKIAQEQGAEILLTGFGRAMSLTERTSRDLPEKVDVLELDANNDEQIAAVAQEIESRWGSLDGVLHAIAFAPPDALGGGFMDTPWESVQTAYRTSAFSLKSIAGGFRPLMSSGGSIVSLDFDATVAWPIYDWMGVSKAALESITRYLARATWGPTGSGSTACRPAPSGRWPQRRFLVSTSSPRRGRRSRHSNGTSPTPSPSGARLRGYYPTGRRRSPERSFT